MTLDINSKPYYDDFNDEKNYHKILFRPSAAVQARELTQIQSILQDQISKFGNHVFQHGSVVIPGNSTADLNADYVKVEVKTGDTLDYTLFQGKTIIGSISGIKAIVSNITPSTATDPLTFYVKYISGGTGSHGNVFLAGESLVSEGTTNHITVTTVNPTGKGSIAHVNKGVFYVNGYFVTVNKQDVIISKYTTTPSCHVLLEIKESFVDSTDDLTLLDPAQGTYNFAAPGADRLRIDLKLVTLPLGSVIGSDYIELMRYDNGVLLEHLRYPKYSELDKSLARRDFDANGNFVVNGLTVSVSEHLNENKNGGVYTVSAGGDATKLVYSVSPGKCYIDGFEVEKIATSKLVANKARTNAHLITTKESIKPSFGQYILATQISGGFSSSIVDVTDGVTTIGTARILTIDYFAGNPVVNPIYRIHITDVALDSGKTTDDIGGLSAAGGTSTAKVVHKYTVGVTSTTSIVANYSTISGTGSRSGVVAEFDATANILYVYKSGANTLPKPGDSLTDGSFTCTVKSVERIVSVGQSSCIFKLPKHSTKSLTNVSSSFDMELIVYKKLIIPSGDSQSNQVANGHILPLEAGSFVAFDAAGFKPLSSFSLNDTATVIQYTGPATTPIVIYTECLITNAQPRTKTRVSTIENCVSSSLVTLSNADVLSITSITAGGVNVTDRYVLNNGQTDFSYERASLSLKPGFETPSANLQVAYEYYSHSVGDFFTVDSYTDLSSSLNEIYSYSSQSTGEEYLLRDCVDFRTTVNQTGSLPVIDSLISTSVTRYMPNYDIVIVDKSGSINVISGIPSDTPKVPVTPGGTFKIQEILVPAYTDSVKDVVSRRAGTAAYTMNDVAKISDRLSRLEEFTTLSIAEANLIQKDLVDTATGLNKYKTGYLVENVSNPFGIADAANPDFAATMNPEDGIFCKTEPTPIDLILNDYEYGGLALTTQQPNVNGRYSGNNGGFITLPYTEVVLVSQPQSSKTTNLNPFGVIQWENSNITLSPSHDYAIETVDSPAVIGSFGSTVGTPTRANTFYARALPLASAFDPEPRQNPSLCQPNSAAQVFKFAPSINMVVGPDKPLEPLAAPSQFGGKAASTPAINNPPSVAYADPGPSDAWMY